MLNSWFSSKSSRHRKTPSNPSAPASDHVQSGPSDASSVSQSTVGPGLVQTPGNLTLSDIPLDEVHAHINDPSVYARTPSLIHSTEKEAGTLMTSDAPASPDTTTQRVSAPERPEGTLFTPQDAIITQIFGKSVQPAAELGHARAGATPPPPSSAPQPSVSLMTRTSDSIPTPTPPSIQAPRARPGPTVTIYDPFSGTKLSEHTPISPSTVTPGDASVSVPLPTADDRKLWSSLERILELQAEIAAMHADMEGVGRGLGNVTHAGGIASVGAGEGGNAGSRKRMGRGQTLPVGDEEPEEHEPEGGTTGGAVSEISTDHSDGEDDDDDDEDGDGVHGYGKRRRDEEFARLAEQFAQRKAAIGGIMNKLDALSVALKTFHTLPPPLFDLAASPSRADTMSSAPLNVSPRLHPSTSPAQPGNPVTPPMASLSPPVPPISALAPPVSSGDLSAPPGPALVVAPVLPQIALPTIIPEAPHVESPADMDYVQSILRGVL